MEIRTSCTIGVPRIVQWRSFTSWGHGSGSGGQVPPSGAQGQSPDRGPSGRSPQKLKNNVKLVYNFLRFPVENLGFNECRSRAWTVGLYFANSIQKIWDSMEEFELATNVVHADRLYAVWWLWLEHSHHCVILVYFLRVLSNKFEPLGTPVGLPKATARVDSRLKLTFGQLTDL